MEAGTGGRLGPYWTCNIRVGHGRPALVVQSACHRSDLASLSEDELRSLGPAIAAAAIGVADAGSVDRVYVLFFNETRPGHVHFHIVPRFTGEIETGNALPDSVDEPFAFEPMTSLTLALSRLSPDRHEPSRFVRTLLWASGKWNSRLSLYRHCRRIGGFDQAESYVSLWMTFWMTAALGSFFVEDWRAFAALSVAWTYRLLDMMLYEIGILLDARQTALISVPRALVLRITNVIEVFLATSALLLSAVGSPSGWSAIRKSIVLVTLQPELSDSSKIAEAIMAVNWAAMLVIATGGIAMLIGKMGDSFRDGAG